MKKRGKINVTAFVLITMFLFLLFELFYFSAVGPGYKKNITSLAIREQDKNIAIPHDSKQEIETVKEKIHKDKTNSPLLGNISITGFFIKFSDKISGADTSSILIVKRNTKPNYFVIACILLGIGICILGVIYSATKKKRSDRILVKKLKDWMDKARSLGYTSTKMEEMLKNSQWNKKLIKKALKEY
jgi:hypothetical protein